MRACRLVVFGAIAVLAVAAAALAAPCVVPSGSHPTIQSAVDDVACTGINLGSQVYTENVEIGRTLSVSGVSSSATTIAGRVLINGATSVVTLGDLTIDGS